MVFKNRKIGELVIMIKKHGFTLAEVLITLGIIGVVAALTVPAVNKIRPDKYKITYLKTYDALSQAVQDLANNSKEYPLTGNVNGANYSFAGAPLMNTAQNNITNSLSNANSWANNTKLCNLLAFMFNGKNPTCFEGYNDVPSGNNNTYWNNAPSFTASNGVQFTVRARTPQYGANPAFGVNVIIDVDGAQGQNCLFGADGCNRPDRFWFFITADGRVVAADPLGRRYIERRKNFLKKDEAINNGIYLSWNNYTSASLQLANAGAGGNNDVPENNCGDDEVYDATQQKCVTAEKICLNNQVWSDLLNKCISTKEPEKDENNVPKCEEGTIYDSGTKKCVSKCINNMIWIASTQKCGCDTTYFNPIPVGKRCQLKQNIKCTYESPSGNDEISRFTCKDAVKQVTDGPTNGPTKFIAEPGI